MPVKLKILTHALLLLVISGISLPAEANCQIRAQDIYQQFKHYREQINSTIRVEQLTPFFSRDVIQYYEIRLANSDSDAEQRRQMTQFWDNLNTARDIVIIFDYTLRCKNDKATLTLITALDTNRDREQSSVPLWKVRVHYQLEDNQWKITSFEYDRHQAGKSYLATEIIDNFAIIR